MLPSASKYVPVKFANHCINILNNKEILNELKVSTKLQKRESLFKNQSRIYNFERNSDVNHIGMKIICKKAIHH